MKKTLILLFFFGFIVQVQAQVGLGLVWAGDGYLRYVNPVEEGVDAKRSSGAAISSLSLGPKLWMGGNNFSFSIEAQANIAPLALNLTEYKGLGAVAFPILGKFNFGAASGFNEDRLLGWSIGGGVQFNRTELFGLTEEFDDIEREFFPTYVGEATLVLGIAGFDAGVYVRLGYGENKSSSLNIGYVLNFNFSQMARMFKRASDGDEREISL